MSFTTFLLQTATTAAEGSTGGGLGMLIPLILIVVIMYFFMIRPQNKKQKETQKMLDALKKGDKVITIGGIHGVVTQTKEQTVVIKVDDGTKIEFNRSAISSVVTDKPASAEKPQKKGFFSFGKKAKAQVKDEAKKDDSKVEEKSADEQKSEEKSAVESEKAEIKSENKKDEKDSTVKEVESGDKKDE